MMSIVYPTLPIALGEPSTIDDIDLEEITQLVSLEAITEKFALSVGLGVTLVDAKGRLLTEPKNFPQFCSFCLQQQCGDSSPNSRG
ncbi:MAG: PocR ligand-binding domain-containing protein [Bacillota bacterium]